MVPGNFRKAYVRCLLTASLTLKNQVNSTDVQMLVSCKEHKDEKAPAPTLKQWRAEEIKTTSSLRAGIMSVWLNIECLVLSQMPGT